MMIHDRTVDVHIPVSCDSLLYCRANSGITAFIQSPAKQVQDPMTDPHCIQMNKANPERLKAYRGHLCHGDTSGMLYNTNDVKFSEVL